MDRETLILVLLDLAERTQDNPEAFAYGVQQLQQMMNEEPGPIEPVPQSPLRDRGNPLA